MVAGWEVTNVLPCLYNVVTALANGTAEGGPALKIASVLLSLSNVVTALANSECLGSRSYVEGG